MEDIKPRLYMNEHQVRPDPNDCGLSSDFWNTEKFKKKLRIVVIK